MGMGFFGHLRSAASNAGVKASDLFSHSGLRWPMSRYIGPIAKRLGAGRGE
jgi:hypothetical protein